VCSLSDVALLALIVELQPSLRYHLCAALPGVPVIARKYIAVLNTAEHDWKENELLLKYAADVKVQTRSYGKTLLTHFGCK
jgi:hypothetical protein